MVRSLKMIVAAGVAVGLLVLSFHLWSSAGRLTMDFARPDVAAAGARCIAVAAFTVAQLFVLLLVVDSIYQRTTAARLVRAGVGIGGSVALVSGIALGWAGH